MKITMVYPGTAAEKAGVHAGDVILSANGYLTDQPGHLAWIWPTRRPAGPLVTTSRFVSDGKVLTIAIPSP